MITCDLPQESPQLCILISSTPINCSIPSSSLSFRSPTRSARRTLQHPLQPSPLIKTDRRTGLAELLLGLAGLAELLLGLAGLLLGLAGRPLWFGKPFFFLQNMLLNISTATYVSETLSEWWGHLLLLRNKKRSCF